MIRIRALRVDGFRGYPKRVTFEFNNNRSMLIFGRNAQGKSTISDAFEFLVSKEGTLERLGLKKGETTSGRAPLRNAELNENEIASVMLSFEHASQQVNVKRDAVETHAEVPPDLSPLIKAAIVPFVIRGPELRQFVYETPRERYEELARSLNASRLTQLQKDIREIKKRLRQDQKIDAKSQKGLDEDVKAHTKGAVKQCDAATLLQWLNACLAPTGIIFQSLSSADPGYERLALYEANERSTRSFEAAHEALSSLFVGEQSVFRDRFKEVGKAQQHIVDLVRATHQAPMANLIHAAADYLRDPSHAPDVCPLCETAYAQTTVGSREHLEQRLHDLACEVDELRLASDYLVELQRAVKQKADEDIGVVRQSLLSVAMPQERTDQFIETLRAAAESAEHIPMFETQAQAILQDLADARSNKTQNADTTYGQIWGTTNALLAIYAQQEEIGRRSQRRKRTFSGVEMAERFIDKRVYEFFEASVAAISKDTIDFYNDVQQFSRVPARIKVALMDDEQEDARGVEVLIDFADLTDVKPQAYLSDSQQHTLALALRLAIVKHFNRDLPFVVLDDVVTSFDAETRVTIAKTLLTRLREMQIIMLTHDDILWRVMRSAMQPVQHEWIVKRIVRYERADGPTFADDKGDVDELRGQIVAGDPNAAAATRRFFERWLSATAPGLGARPLMPPASDPFNYAYRDLLEALIAAAGKCGLKEYLRSHPQMDISISLLRDAVVANKGTHGNDGIDAGPSITDTEATLNDIVAFIDLFVCSQCGNRTFRYDQNLSRPRCAKPQCAAPLAIPPALSVTSGASGGEASQNV